MKPERSQNIVASQCFASSRKSHKPPPKPTVSCLNSSVEKAKVCRLASAVTRAAFEVLLGVRHPQRLSRLIAPLPLNALTLRAALLEQAHEAGGLLDLYRGVRICSVHPCSTAPGIYEVSVVVTENRRYRALALRLEQKGGEWKVTALAIG